MEDYILEHCQYTARGRLGEILCLIPTLQAISCELVDTIQFSKILGYAEVDALINEMLLNRGKNRTLKIRILMSHVQYNSLPGFKCSGFLVPIPIFLHVCDKINLSI